MESYRDYLKGMDAVAGERGMVLAFRVCEETEEYEPVFMKFGGGAIGEPGETAMVAISDRNGLSLGRYVMPRARLDEALAGARDSLAADCSSADRLL
jgi:hypothetical protein